MAIKLRSTVSTTSQTDFSRDDYSDARSPELQGLRYSVWQFVRDNPRVTRDDISRGLGMKSSTITARVKELIDLGYLIEPPGITKLNSSGVRARVLMLSDRKACGKVNDKVRVEVTLTVDCNGVYGVTARVVNGLKQSGRATPIATKQMTLTAPPTASYDAFLDTSTVAPVSRLNLQQHADQIIDADYKIVEVE